MLPKLLPGLKQLIFLSEPPAGACRFVHDQLINYLLFTWFLFVCLFCGTRDENSYTHEESCIPLSYIPVL